ncbi:MAG: DUF4258 domain-containing protein [Rhodospirillales bacterium]
MKPRITKHAQRRMQQRGITELEIEILMSFGEDHYQKGGGTLTYIPEKKLGRLRQAIDRLSKVAVIKGDEEQIISAMHLTRKIRSTDLVA